MHDDLATVLDIVLACRRIADFIFGLDGAQFLADQDRMGSG